MDFERQTETEKKQKYSKKYQKCTNKKIVQVSLQRWKDKQKKVLKMKKH